ncbi:MAG: hypothetical protein R3178_10645, partial [Rhodothermales bacterium]|nr:hypothetical protein [Rhodothermales bacterium]
MPDSEILSPERVHRIVVRLAYQVLERNRGADNLVILGILKNGEKIGEAIANEIARVEHPVPVYPLDVSAFRDDVDREGREEVDGDLDLTDRDVVLVDERDEEAIPDDDRRGDLARDALPPEKRGRSRDLRVDRARPQRIVPEGGPVPGLRGLGNG